MAGRALTWMMQWASQSGLETSHCASSSEATIPVTMHGKRLSTSDISTAYLCQHECVGRW